MTSQAHPAPSQPITLSINAAPKFVEPDVRSWPQHVDRVIGACGQTLPSVPPEAMTASAGGGLAGSDLPPAEADVRRRVNGAWPPIDPTQRNVRMARNTVDRSSSGCYAEMRRQHHADQVY